MSTPCCRIAATALLLFFAALNSRFAAGDTTVPEPRVDAYVTTDGTPYFALSLAPNARVSEAGARDVVILFDTSASQTGLVREKALNALAGLLDGLHRGDRVRLFAVDLDAVPMSKGFAAPQSDETLQAVAALKARTPLGATDMPAVLRAAVDSFDGTSASPRVLVYIGDGLSAAHFVVLDEYRKLADTLARARVSVSSYAVGIQVDGPLLASLANATGGMLAIDGEDVEAKHAASFLADAVRGTVLWPVKVNWPKAFVEVYPTRMPPLRSDRDTIVLGRSGEGQLSGTLRVAMTTEVGRKSQSFEWTLTPGESNPDFAFLPVLVESARGDDGLRLITLGTAGLNEARRILNQGTELLGKLSQQALVSGNLETAERLADEALRRDPDDEPSLAVKKQLAKMHAGTAVAAEETGSDEKLEIKRFSSEQAAPPSPGAPSPGADEPAVPSAPAAEPAAAEPTAPVPPPVDEINDAEGRLLADTEQHNRLVTEMIRAQVDDTLRKARTLMATEPEGVEQSLKLVLERVRNSPELKAEVRAQLQIRLEAALREAARRGVDKDIRDRQRLEAQAAAEDQRRILQGLARDQEKLTQLMERFNSLMDEGNYLAADEIGTMEVARLAPELPISRSTSLTAHMTGARQADLALRMARQKAVIDTLGTVEVSLMPFPDDQPVVYPPADVWFELTERRKQYASTDLKTVSPIEQKIRNALDNELTKMEFVDTPLQDAVEWLKDYHKIEIQLDTRALEDVGVGSDTPVTRNVDGITLKSGLRLLLRDMELTYMIRDEVLLITTKDKAEAPEAMVTKAYPVADLVIPVRSMGGMGGMGMMGGGMMGGMGGGMMGGMGGMGGGMGGMMGGMGGMGGGMGGMGMGGGMFSVPDHPAFQAFAVPDDLKLGPKTKASSKAQPARGPQAKAPQPAPASRPAKATAIELSIAPGSDPEVAWNDYFAAHEDVSPSALRETVRQLWHARKYGEVIGMVRAALRSGQPQPWMYEVMSLAMRAAGSSPAEIERALMSGVDFGSSSDDLMYVGQYMARIGLDARALKVFREVSIIDPLRPEPYLYGLQLASRLNDVEGIKWSSLGILKQAWPKEKSFVVDQAKRAAAAVVEQLKSQNRVEEAADFQAELDQAAVRDCIVRVSWTGDADVDLMIEEPSGAICAFRNPRTSGGGVLLGDSSSEDNRRVGRSITETYECPEAFSGTYRVLVRRVWGKITAGKVTVDVYAHYGTPEEKHLRDQIPLGDQDALVVFDLDKGRRQEPLAEQQLANAAAQQLAVNQAILAQQVNQIASSSQGANTALASSRQGLLGIPFINQAVGYQPQITVLPSGTSLSVSGVVSADRRYVRITPIPLFSGVSSVTTYNLIQGSTSTQSGGGLGGTQAGQNPVGGGGGLF